MRAENFREKNVGAEYLGIHQLNALPVANDLGKCVQDIDGPIL
jgi:hypothetical protein